MAVKWIVLLVFLALWIGLSVGVQLGRRVQIAAGVAAAKQLLAARKERELHGIAKSDRPPAGVEAARELIEAVERHRPKHGETDQRR